MKLKKLFAGMILCLAVASCIQDEALNVEAAIDGCSGSNIQLANINTYSKTVSIYVSKSTDLSALEIKFELPDGASINPVNALANDDAPKYDFSTSKVPITSEQTLEQYQRMFKVTSESGTTEAVYTITVIKSELPTEYHFENIEDGNNNYHIFYEFNQQKAEMLQWASGNPGFQLTGMGKNTMDYPTLQTQGYIGKGVKLETKGTGSLGLTVGMPIAAGNLFIGSFEVGNALKDAKAATKFGFPFFKHPTKLEGYYKFKPGTEYISGIDKSQSPPKIVIDPSMEGKDKGDIYAILYRADNVNDFLDGNLNFDSEEKIVYIARISDTEMKETDTWTHFSIPFEHRKEIEQSALDEGKYKLAVVFSSSIEGANFKGSIGSTLWIDEVTIHCEEDEQNNE
ncbi:PCMD domain-containing protein [Bacteroides sp. A1-P5]|uniref:PCMD domain-containing protein n=2 Tax=Bacteroides TaxID=816 RepID=A0ABU5HVY4_9BACE|nr:MULTISPECIES: PCMD domain-containing protein [Bacteroides]MBV3832082.1 PCMD domain-containing protein [Bacteroides xylanisolvens]MBV3875128.1 PCMD domain-containing protein [Bacteroides xylanisolvens]MBV3880407.1 PCMD domain-containing protein [Bacteroides xylanisolvens]MBV3906126.1 PCMD domain-containing protein [Bacteroides xylanisolvens]MBV3911879.1 PCMD domain-containing protein [Bacteroides xylanisolvens]